MEAYAKRRRGEGDQTVRFQKFFGSGGGKPFLPSDVVGMAAWFRNGLSITVTGAGVSQWDDQSGNGRHLKQTADTNRPALQADGSILFDGSDNFLKCDAFTLAQPETVYLLAKQITSTNGDAPFDGDTLTSMRMQQTSTPFSILINAGAGACGNGNWLSNTYAVLCSVFNGASSLTQVNQGAPSTGDPGAANAGGFTLGATGGATAFANIEVKEVIVYSGAHDATTRLQIINYLATIGGIAL